MNEFDYIEKYFKPLTNEIGRDLKNDAAIFNQRSGYDLIISTDTLVEDIHFFGIEDPADIAKKSLRVNLSDMAAMGAKPVFYNLALSVPKEKARTFIPKFAKGLEEDQKTFNIKLIGGDLTSSLKYVNITITIFGETRSGKAISRSSSKLGDYLYVSGILGLSKIGLDNFNINSKEFELPKKKYLIPEPRIDLGNSLKNIANSMIDISDGLVQDAIHLAKNSQLSIELDLNKIPLPKIGTISEKDKLNFALYGGDDYELLFSCNPCHKNFLKNLSSKIDLKLSMIGKFKKYEDQYLIFKDNSSKPKEAYLHF